MRWFALTWRNSIKELTALHDLFHTSFLGLYYTPNEQTLRPTASLRNVD